MLIYHSLNLRALRGCNKAPLTVIWWANKSQVMQALFEDWLKSSFCPTIENYCKQNLTFKVFLDLDNAPGEPTVPNGPSKNVKVVFLPPNTMSFLQPMD
jgi:hypothetical protein